MFLYLACPASISFFSSYLRGRPSINLLLGLIKLLLLLLLLLLYTSMMAMPFLLETNVSKKTISLFFNSERNFGTGGV